MVHLNKLISSCANFILAALLVPMSHYYDILLDITSITLDTLRKIGVRDCCFIGSVACRLYKPAEGRSPRVRHH